MTKNTVRVSIVAGIVIFFCLIFHCTQITTVKVTGNTLCTEAEMQDYYMENYILKNGMVFFIREKIGKLPKHPVVQEVDVKWKGIKNVELKIYEKAFVGCISYMSQYVYFDREGTVLKSSTELTDGIPCIKGVEFGTFTLYETLQVESDTIFNKIMNITQTINHLSLEVDEIVLDKEEAVTMIAGDVTIKLGKKDFYDEQLNAMPSVLTTAKKEKLKGVIDMRTYKEGDRIILK